jgi:BirA family transcriptional regulator, biotin operon repressor / biotin---[acetyl-CoA-carboxylase] ligase
MPVWPETWHVRVVESTGSTNADLLAAAAIGAPDRSVLVAAFQTSGRGRLDRQWDAPPGANLLVSMLFRQLPDNVYQLSQRVALAAANAVSQLTGLSPEFKWPNDLLLGGAKLAGVLAQSGVSNGRVDHVVVGIGLNIGWAPDGAALLGDDVHPLDLLHAMLVEFDELPDDVYELYRAQLGTIGLQVRVQRHDDEVEGRAVDVDVDGRLAVIDDCAVTHHIDTGDVVHLRPRPLA